MIDLNEVKRIVEAEQCPEHHQHPAINMTGDQLAISACCDTFHKHVEARMEAVIMEQIQKAAENIFGQMGK